MSAPLTEMQKFCCSTGALNSQEAITLEDFLYNDGAASFLIHFLELEDKRSLRLVCHAGKDAVDKTVTSVCIPSMYRKNSTWPYTTGIDYGCILSNSNWKDIKSLAYSSTQRTNSGEYCESQGLTHLAEAGLLKLESLNLRLAVLHAKDDDIDKVVKAGWKLKKLNIAGTTRLFTSCAIPSKWFAPLVRDANWPLEELSVLICTDSIADLIAASEWKLKTLCLSCAQLSPEGVETLMQGSWVSTVERLYMGLGDDNREHKTARVISQASHRALNLLELKISNHDFDNKDALILAEGSYPNLRELYVRFSINVSGMAAILRKCSKMEVFEFGFSRNTAYHIDDPKDAKLVAEHLKAGIMGDYLGNLDNLKAHLADYLSSIKI